MTEVRSSRVELGRVEMGTACGYIVAVKRVEDVLRWSGRLDGVSDVVRMALAELVWQQVAQTSWGIVTEEMLDRAVEQIECELKKIY